jgi:peptidoglycan/LPS O-acetylase OafA/YrhL
MMNSPFKGMAEALGSPQTLNRLSKAKSRYRPEIDGLRAFAIIAVIINHFNKDLLPSGYLGVDIFFVISGYVITSSLSGRESNNFGDFLSGFYERRIKRLVPALVVFVLVTSVLICLFNPDPGTALKTGTTSLFGLSNLYLFKQSTDYFAQSTELNPFTHTWSLGVEEQFYLLFPFLIWFSGFGRQAHNGARNLFLWIGALSVASLTGFIYLYQTNQPAAYFLMPPRFWEMAAGCLVFIGFQKRAKIEQALEKAPPLMVVAVMVGVMFLPIHSAVPATIAIVVLSSVLIACLKNELPYVGRYWSNHKYLVDTWWLKGGKHVDSCHAEGAFGSTLIKKCLDDDGKYQQEVGAYLIGDSHARNYLMAIKHAVAPRKVKYLTMGRHCAYLPSSLIPSDIEKRSNCTAYNKQVNTFLMSRTSRGNIIFVGQALFNKYRHTNRMTHEYIDYVGQLAQKVRGKGVNVILLDGTSPPEIEPVLCVEAPWRPFVDPQCILTKEYVHSRYAKFDSIAQESSTKNFHYAPLREYLCVLKYCGQRTKSGLPIWHDKGHITEEVSWELGIPLRQKLQELHVLPSSL